MQSLTHYLTRIIKSRKLQVFLIFLLIASTILFITKLSKIYTYTTRLEVESANLPSHYVLAEGSTNTILVTVRGVGFRLMKLYLNKPRLNANLQMVMADTIKNTYLWPTKFVQSELIALFDDNIEVIAVQPEVIAYKFNKFYKKDIPVKLNSKLSFQRGFDMFEAPKIVPNKVTVIGPKTAIDTINYIETDTLVLDNISASSSNMIGLKKPENTQVSAVDNTVEVLIKSEKFTEGELNIPIHLINVPDSLSITFFPKTVTASFYTSLSRFNKIQANQFKIIADYRKVHIGNPTLLLEIVEQPDSIKRVTIKQQKIEYIINK